TDSGRLVMTWRGKTIVDLSRDFLNTNGVQQTAKVHVISPTEPELPGASSLTEALSRLNTASQKGLGERFDGSVGAGTVLWPFGGEHQLTPPDAMVAKLPLLEGQTDVATFMSWAYDPFISSASPFHGAVYAITESVCKAVAAGARLSDVRLTLQEYFPKLGTNPSRWGLPFAALLGAFHAQHKLRLAAIGGKDSMSGSFNELDVPPTLVSFALAPGDAKLALSPEFKKAGSTVSLVEVARDADNLPDFDALLQTTEALHQLNKEGKILSLKALGSSGLAPAIAISSFGNRIGFKGDFENLFGERHFSFVIEHQHDLPESLGAQVIGETTGEPTFVIGTERHPLSELETAWTGKFEPVYSTKPASVPGEESDTHIALSEVSPIRNRTAGTSKPRVIIPAFPGTNSEYDSAKAFNEAGAESKILVFRNLTAAHVEDSIKQLAESIRQSQILMLPGGFSAGDEPDGSGKFIATILRSPRVADAVMDLLKNRDGLILGICNGFQALIKTGLVPFGEIRDSEPNAPTLAHNDIARHISCYAWTKVINSRSPWLSKTQPGDLHRIPLSHGEGKFVANPETIAQLIANGQIATQYVDANGVPSMDPAINPNGSISAIEGITSPCGRVLGKMGHTERSGLHVAKNIPGEKHQPLFAGGVG
ncbi:MAG TPA: phosphoribosylformylglycinamidine synthase subunit PurQ, partial [Luteolibacter sp.]|nr:phosphoribosylformylglycinamidine synthase subunit PurQ [Luteolibacter sp.]